MALWGLLRRISHKAAEACPTDCACIPRIHGPHPTPASSVQIEEFEAEAEAAATAKKGKKPAPRVVHMEESITRHRQHIMRLEQLLRLLDNDAVQGEPAAN